MSAFIIACIEVLFINKHKGNVKHFKRILCDKKTTYLKRMKQI